MNMKKLLAAVIGAFFSTHHTRIVRGRVCDADTFGMTPYRMQAGFPGDINRGHPFSDEADLICVATPPTAYGQPVIIDTATQSVRPFAAGDTAVTTIRGVTVRPYPSQQTTGGMTSNFGAATPPVTGIIDVMTTGYINVKIPVGQLPKKGDAVFVWCAVASGAHVQGGFENASSGGNTAALDTVRYTFNGTPDASGNCEIKVNL